MRNIFWCLIVVGVFLNAAVFAQPELDTTFNSTGKKVIQSGAAGATSDVIVLPDNKIVLVSGCRSINFANGAFCAIRLNEDGSLDSNFGSGSASGGFAFTFFDGTQGGGATSAALQNDGKLVLTGFVSMTSSSNSLNLAMVRYNSDGTPDSSFGTGGKIILDIAPGLTDFAKKVAIQPDGKIVVVGYQGTSTSGFQQFVARFLTDGTLDSSFGKGGIVKTVISDQSTIAVSVALQADGKIVVGGNLLNFTSPSSGSYLFERLNPDGSPDASFDGDGIKSIAYGSPNFPDAGIRSLAVRPDGRIVALGHGNVIYSLNADGSMDTSFDGDGTRTAMNTNADTYELMLSAGGRITVVGHYPVMFNSDGTPLLYLAARYMLDGSPDTTFSDDGYLSINVDSSMNDGARAVAVDSRGRTIIGGLSANGTVHFPFENPLFSLVRLIAPPPFPVVISGRVTRQDGSPVSRATVTLQNNAGLVGTSRTNPFGYYSFPNVMTGQNYSVSAKVKGLIFLNRSVFVADEISSIDLIGEEP